MREVAIMSKNNLYTSIFVILLSIFFIIYELTNNGFVWNFYLTYSILLITIGEFIAVTIIINIQNIVYIRSEEESLKSALPKVPFEVKKAFIFIPINLILLLITGLTSYYYITDEPIKSHWFIILFLPLAIHMLSLIPFFMFRDTGFIKLKKKALEDDDIHSVILKISKKLANKNSKSCRKTNTKQYQTILYYLKSGQNPDEVFEDRYTLLLPSACCGDEKLVKLLIEHGSNVNFKSSLGKTALILASTHGSLEIVSLLVENGANVDEKDLDEKTALYYAEKSGFKDIVNILKKDI